MEAYITRRTLTGRPKYHSCKTSVSGLCLPGSFGMAKEAEQKLTVGPVGSPLSPFKNRADVADYCYRALAESQEWNESEQLLSRVREHLGIDPEGGTDPDNFERAVEGNQQFRMEMVRQAEVDQRKICWRNWPYKDEKDSSMPSFG